MRATIICNPNAGRREVDGGIGAAVGILRDAGWTVDVCTSSSPGDGARLAAEAAQNGADVVLAAGGDGTLNEAVQGLVGTDTALGYIPYGTVNIWAREVEMHTGAHAHLDRVPR